MRKSDCRPEESGPGVTRTMIKGGPTKGGLPKPGVQEKVRLPVAHSSVTMKTSRSSGTLAADLRLSRLKRASSDDTLAKPGLGAAAMASRMKKTVTTGTICELADARPRSLTGVSSAKKSGIPALREIPPSASRERASLRDQLRTSSTKKMISSSSTSNLSTLAKNSRVSVKTKVDGEANDRAVLECQVKELLAEAKAKEFEISKLRTELQRCKGRGSPDSNSPEGAELESLPPEVQAMVRVLREKNGKFQRELATLREENQSLKEKLLSLEQSPHSTTSSTPASLASPSKLPVNSVLQDGSTASADGSPVKISPSSSSDITKGSSSPDSSEFEKIPSRSDSACSGPAKGCADVSRDLSVECLTEKIQRMEESHHSTAEELQATLQELSDQQQVVQELTAENERLAEEKGLLQERVELLTQKNESLLVRLQEQAEIDETRARAARATELEQRYAELVQNSHFEREKLVDIQQQLTGSLRALEKDHQEAQGLVGTLREERDALQRCLEKDQEASSQMERALEEQRLSVEALKAENGRLKAQADIEKQKVAELKAMQSASDSTELQKLLKAAHSEKERLELAFAELKQELSQATGEADRVKGLLAKAESECQRLQVQNTRQEQEQSTSLRSLEDRNREKELQVKELKETIFELEDQVEQHRAVRLHTNQTILDLESQIKKLEEQKFDLEKQLKALGKQMKDDTEEWRRFQADLQTAVVVANDIKVEAQQEVRALRRRLLEEQEQNMSLEAELEQLQGSRLASALPLQQPQKLL